MAEGSYKQFCPVAMAAEILCTRWTIVLLRELVAGSTRFNELRRGLPRISPALLSRRLKDLEAAGIIVHAPSARDRKVVEYRLTNSGHELAPIVEAFGVWGHRQIEADLSLQHLDVQLLMWDMRRNLNTTPMPKGRNVVQFVYPELSAAQRSWWLIVDPADGVDLCSVDPGFDVDLYVSVDLRTMTAIWMGLDTVRAAVASRRMLLTGDGSLPRPCKAGWASARSPRNASWRADPGRRNSVFVSPRYSSRTGEPRPCSGTQVMPAPINAELNLSQETRHDSLSDRRHQSDRRKMGPGLCGLRSRPRAQARRQVPLAQRQCEDAGRCPSRHLADRDHVVSDGEGSRVLRH